MHVESDSVQVSPESEPVLSPSIQVPIYIAIAPVVLLDAKPVATTPAPTNPSWTERLRSGLSKIHGTAKGGIICAIARERPIPLRFIGVGETIDDLRPFNATDYAKVIFE